jgi:hypothetical protein
MNEQIERGDDELAFWLKRHDFRKSSEVTAAYKIKNKGCVVCRRIYVSYNDLLRHYIIHITNTEDYFYKGYNKKMIDLSIGIIQQLIIFESVDGRKNSIEYRRKYKRANVALYELSKNYGLMPLMIAWIIGCNNHAMVRERIYRGMLEKTGGNLPTWWVNAAIRE